MKKSILLGLIMIGFVVITGCAGEHDGGIADPPASQQQPPMIVQPNCQNGLCANQMSLQHRGDLRVTNQQVFEKFLEVTGRCNLNTSWARGKCYGNCPQNCSNYSKEGYIYIQGQGSAANGAQAVAVNVVGGTYYHALQVSVATTFQPINSNQGFVLQDTSQFNFPTGRIRVVAQYAQASSANFNVILSYQDIDFATAVVQRW